MRRRLCTRPRRTRHTNDSYARPQSSGEPRYSRDPGRRRGEAHDAARDRARYLSFASGGTSFRARSWSVSPSSSVTPEENELRRVVSSRWRNTRQVSSVEPAREHWDACSSCKQRRSRGSQAPDPSADATGWPLAQKMPTDRIARARCIEAWIPVYAMPQDRTFKWRFSRRGPD